MLRDRERTRILIDLIGYDFRNCKPGDGGGLMDKQKKDAQQNNCCQHHVIKYIHLIELVKVADRQDRYFPLLYLSLAQRCVVIKTSSHAAPC